MRRLKNLTREVNARSPHGLEQLLSVSQYTGVTTRRANTDGTGPETRAATLEGYKIANPGELVVNIMLAWNGSLGVSSIAGIVSPAYAVFRFNQVACPVYYHHLLRLPTAGGRIKADSTGVVESRLRLYPENFNRIEVPVPPRPEQEQIALYIDWTDRRINRLIRAKRRFIELLNEQKQAIIHRAVTRGLDPNVRLKPSGIDWLGDIPEHWEVWQVGHFARVGNGSTPSRSNPSYWLDGYYPWLNSACVNQGNVTQSDQLVTHLALRECHLPIVPAGSVLLAITGQGKTRGTAAELAIEATINQHMVYLTPRNALVSPSYLHLYLDAAYSELRRISGDSGSTRGALTCEDIKHFKVAVPTRDEQESILRMARQDLAGVESAVEHANREIDLLREYRTRLIADVVTGKLDVRGVELPSLDEDETVDALNLDEDQEPADDKLEDDAEPD